MEQVLSRSLWNDVQPRPKALAALLGAAIYFIPESFDGSPPVGKRARISALFGLQDGMSPLGARELMQQAVRGLSRLEHGLDADAELWESRERTWRERRISELAAAIVLAESLAWVSPSQPNVLRDVPHDFAAEPPLLVGRGEALAALAAAKDPAILITGAPGVGKTAVALTVAHSLASAEEYLGGCLQIDLGAYGAEKPMSLIEALKFLLARLGADASQLPEDSRALAALYSSITTARPVLVLADNAPDSETVLPLIGGGHSRLVVTSRNDLPLLRTRAKTTAVTLEPLSTDQSLELLGSLVGTPRVEAERDAASTIARLCGQLPLTLNIVGSRLSRRKNRSLATVAAELSAAAAALEQPLLESSDTLASVFDWSYRRLRRDEKNALIILGNVPYLGVPVERLETLRVDARALDRLIEEHLVEPEDASGRVRIHDLMKEYLRSSIVIEGAIAAGVLPPNWRAEYFGSAIEADWNDLKRNTLYLLGRSRIRSRSDLQALDLEHPGVAIAQPGPVFLLNLTELKAIDIVLLDWRPPDLDLVTYIDRLTLSLVYLMVIGNWTMGVNALELILLMLRQIARASSSTTVRQWVSREREWVKESLDECATIFATFAARIGRGQGIEGFIQRIRRVAGDFQLDVDVDLDAAWRRIYSSEVPDELIDYANRHKTFPPISDAPPGTEEALSRAIARRLAGLEVQAAHLASTGRIEEARQTLATLVEEADSFMAEAEDLALFWDYEPARLRYALLLGDLGELELASDEAMRAAISYSRRGWTGYGLIAGNVHRRLLDQRDSRATDSK